MGKDRRQVSNKAFDIQTPFREHEVKLDAGSLKDLYRVALWIAHDSHYQVEDPQNFQEPFSEAMLIGGPLTPEIGVRRRYYYDDVDLNGFRNDIEVRIQEGVKKKDPYKQVVKIARRSNEDEAMDRMEYSASLRQPYPDLSVVKNGKGVVLRAAFNVKALGDAVLYPLMQMTMQRRKMTYRPKDAPDCLIECALDYGVGQTFTNHVWSLYQVELESKEGDPGILSAEGWRMQCHVGGLTPEYRSKPTPGFDVLDRQIESAEARHIARTHLKPDCFQVFQNLPFLK